MSRILSHARLVALLVSAGWRVFPESDGVHAVPHVIVLGTAASVFSSLLPVFSALGVPASRVPDLLRSMHVHAVRVADQIVRARPRLEHSPAFRSFLAASPDPP